MLFSIPSYNNVDLICFGESFRSSFAFVPAIKGALMRTVEYRIGKNLSNEPVRRQTTPRNARGTAAIAATDKR
jgi:hypothetical protein